MLTKRQNYNLLLKFMRTEFQSQCQISTSRTLSNRGQLVINCRRQQYNFYTNDHYNKLDEVPLASKGWNHNKSKGDYFIIRPTQSGFSETFHSFRELGIDPNIITCLKENGIDKATAFQAEAIPVIHNRSHVILAAETGCGKTITYLLPIIESLKNNKTNVFNSPKALILVPNRELAHQIAGVAQKVGSPFGLRVKSVVGGKTKSLMMNPEFTEMDILVGTPGAIGKLSSVGVFKLNDVLHTVLDEADTLLDDSFVERMAGIMKKVCQSQVILVSATFPKSLPDMLKPIEDNLEQVISPRLHKPLLNITQQFYRIIRSVKPQHLLETVEKNKDPMIVFTNKNETCNWLAMYLREHGHTCANINGDMNYAIRMHQWDDFIAGKAQILSATDIGSRGLNTIQVKHVVNYDFPLHAADYLHRVGRIGRLGSPKSCVITNFITGPLEVKLVQQIEMAVRRREALENVDGNITNIVQNKIRHKMREAA